VDQHRYHQYRADGELSTTYCYYLILHGTDDLVVLRQSLAERAKGRADLLKNATEKEQQIIDLE
jgi:hypothetical protein